LVHAHTSLERTHVPTSSKRTLTQFHHAQMLGHKTLVYYKKKFYLDVEAEF
jgi:hypothetical protein